VLDELSKYGYIDQMNVVENLGEHMSGNVYVKYSDESEAEKALKALHGRFYAGERARPCGPQKQVSTVRFCVGKACCSCRSTLR
jgi:hypothetical protein